VGVAHDDFIYLKNIILPCGGTTAEGHKNSFLRNS